MELALYCPNYGYYEKEEDIIGRQGDYYTSASVGSLFGELLAFQFAEWLQRIQESSGGGAELSSDGKAGERGQSMRIVEAGAHGGGLARDILGWISKHRPGLFDCLEYCIVEPSERRRIWQRRKLDEFGDRVLWVGQLAELTGEAFADPRVPFLAGLRGVIFSNELLDAMPAHRLGWDAKARTWYEWGVTLQLGRFVWTRITDEGASEGRQQSSAPAAIPHFELPVESGLLDVLPDGFTIELCPAAEQWWRTAAMVLGCGKLVAVDYGLKAEEFFMPERSEGTLRAYHRHRASNDVLACPGDQDITAHVNFTAIRAAGESAGLRTDAFQTQAQFLTSIAARTWADEAPFGKWTSERTRQFQTLVHPAHLGRAFRVLVQERSGPHS